MAAAKLSITARLKKLDHAKQRAAQIKTGVTISSRPMSEMVGVHWTVLRDWCNEIDGFEQAGAFVRGGNGIEWEFNPRKTVAFLIKHFKTKLEREGRKSRAITKAVGVTISGDDDAPSLSETKDLVNLTMTVTAAKEKQGDYTPAADMRDFIVGYNQAIVEGILGVRTKVDPSGALSPALRKAVDDELRTLVVKVNGIAEQFIKGRSGAGLQQGGTS